MSGLSSTPPSRALTLGIALLLDGGCLDASRPEPDRAQRLAREGRNALRHGRGTEAIEALSQSADLRARRGDGAAASRDLHAAAFAALRLETDPRLARRLLDRAHPLLPPGTELQALHPYYEGLASAMSARHVDAVRHYRRARARLLAVNRGERALGVDEVLASSLLHLGRWTDAAAVLARLRAAESRSTCGDARRLGNLGWLEIALAEAEGRAAPASTLGTLHSARTIYETQDCGDVPAAVDHNMAYALLSMGKVEAAAAALEGKHAAPQGEERWFRWELESRVEAARNHLLGAIAILGSALRDETVRPVDARHRLLLLRARLRARQGAVEAALQDYAEADRLLDDLVHRVPLGEGRAALTRAQAPHLSQWLALLLDRGQIEAAECVARRARARTLAAAARSLRLGTLDAAAESRWAEAIGQFRREREAERQLAKSSWQVPSEELPAHRARMAKHAAGARAALEQALRVLEGEHDPLQCSDLPEPQGGELFLTFAPLPKGGVVFVRDTDGVVSRRRQGAQPFAHWPRRVDVSLERAKRVRLVVVEGAVSDPHVTPWRGRPLALHRPVVFGLDLPSSRPRSDEATPGPALLVSDPEGNLPGARSEASAVEPLLKARGFQVRVLQGAQAQLQSVHELLGEARHFHYAGHAEDATRAVAHDGLRLDGGALSPGDVLTLDAAPATVVLTGCRTLGEARGAVLGVAQAFLLTGARAVLASGEDVDDRLGTALGRAIYDNYDEGLENAFVGAARTLEEAGSRDWRAFQVWVR